MGRPPVSVSIIIPCWNKADFTEGCLKAIAANTPESSSYEVVLVDNGSTDRTPELLSGLDGQHRVIRNETNLGFARACNQGAQAANGEYLLFLNNDTEPHAGWLEPLLAAFERDPRVGAAGSLLLYPDGRVQHGGLCFAPGPFHWLYGVEPDEHPEVLQARDLQGVTGACVMVRRKAFEACGGFDEGFVNGCEDIDLCLKLRAAGWKIRYEPASVLTHHESISEGRHDSDNVNLKKLMARWGPRLLADKRRLDFQAMGQEARISVAMTTLDDGGSLDQTISSLLAVLAGNDEIVIVDRGSSGVTLDILARWSAREPRVKVAAFEGASVTAALDLALNLASGETFWLVRPGILFEPAWAKALEAKLAGPGIGAVSIDDRGSIALDLEGPCVAIHRGVLEQVGLLSPDPLTRIAHIRDRLVAAGYEIASLGLAVGGEGETRSPFSKALAVDGLKTMNLLLDADWGDREAPWLPVIRQFASTFTASEPTTLVLAGATDAALCQVSAVLEAQGGSTPDVLCVEAHYAGTPGLLKLCQGVVAVHPGRADETRRLAGRLGIPVLDEPDRDALESWARSDRVGLHS